MFGQSVGVLASIAMLVATAACSRERPAARTDAPAVAPIPLERARPRVVVLGDSLGAGFGLLSEQAFPAILQQRIVEAGYDFEVVNASVSGDTTAGGLRRLEWALDGDVRVLIVALGGNDGLRGLSVEDMGRNLREMVRRARARQVAVVLAGMEAPPNYGAGYTARFRQVYQDVAREERLVFVPFLLAGVAGNPDLNQPDGIHPNAAGARRVADTVWSALQPMLDAAGPP
jgi:acyl-CoA thioesterase-1